MARRHRKLSMARWHEGLRMARSHGGLPTVGLRLWKWDGGLALSRHQLGLPNVGVAQGLAHRGAADRRDFLFLTHSGQVTSSPLPLAPFSLPNPLPALLPSFPHSLPWLLPPLPPPTLPMITSEVYEPLVLGSKRKGCFIEGKSARTRDVASGNDRCATDTTAAQSAEEGPLPIPFSFASPRSLGPRTKPRRPPSPRSHPRIHDHLTAMARHILSSWCDDQSSLLLTFQTTLASSPLMLSVMPSTPPPTPTPPDHQPQVIATAPPPTHYTGLYTVELPHEGLPLHLPFSYRTLPLRLCPLSPSHPQTLP